LSHAENGSKSKPPKNKKGIETVASPKIETSTKDPETEMAHINLKKNKKKERSQSSKVDDQ